MTDAKEPNIDKHATRYQGQYDRSAYFKCKYCDKKTHKLSEFRKHFRRKHSDKINESMEDVNNGNIHGFKKE